MSKLPNILLFFADQWRGDCMSHLGQPAVDTPYLTELAAGGTTFTSAYTPCPSCIAARACLITGMTPNGVGRLGYQDNVAWTYENTLMRLLRDAGYQTMCSGKTHFYPQRSRLGFEELALYDPQRLDPNNMDDYRPWLAKMTNGQIRDTTDDMNSNCWMAHPWVHPEHLHPSTWTSNAVIDQLTRRDPMRPFFSFVGYHRPHPPIDPPLAWYERFADRDLPPLPVGDWAAEFDHPVTGMQTSTGRLPQHEADRMRRAYYAQLAHLDFQIGRVLWHLQKNEGEAFGNTIVIFTSDHGELLGDHHLYRKTNGFEGSAKVPMVVRLPRRVQCKRGQFSDVPVTLSDIMPTILQEAGLASPTPLDGASLSTVLRGDSLPGREFVHGEHSDPRGSCQFITDGKRKLIWQSVTGREWFFDLQNDPQELRNLAANPSRAEEIELWRSRLAGVLAGRPEDDLTENGRLKAGGNVPAVRQWVLDRANEAMNR